MKCKIKVLGKVKYKLNFYQVFLKKWNFAPMNKRSLIYFNTENYYQQFFLFTGRIDALCEIKKVFSQKVSHFIMKKLQLSARWVRSPAG